MSGPPPIPTEPPEPLPIGARPKDQRGDRIYYAGAWRSPEGVENVRRRMRLRQRERRKNGSPK